MISTVRKLPAFVTHFLTRNPSRATNINSPIITTEVTRTIQRFVAMLAAAGPMA